MQTSAITCPLHGNTGIQSYNPKARPNERLNQISNVSNTPDEHSINTPCSRSSDTQRSLLRSVCEFFSPSSSASKQKPTPKELAFIEEGKSLILKRYSFIQQNQQCNNFSFSSAPTYGWKTVFGLGLLTGVSMSYGAFLLARQQNGMIPGNSCPPNNYSPVSPFSMPLPPETPSTTEILPFMSDTVNPFKKAEPLTTTMNTLKPVQLRREQPKGDFFKQTKVCNNSTTHYKHSHVKHINANNYHRYCFLYSTETPSERAEDVNKPVARVVQPKRNIDTGKLKIKNLSQ